MLEPTSVKHQLLNSNSSEQTAILSDMSIMATRATTRRARPLKDPVPSLETPQNTFSNLNEKKNKQSFSKMQSSSPVIQLRTQFVEEDSEDFGDISRNPVADPEPSGDQTLEIGYSDKEPIANPDKTMDGETAVRKLTQEINSLELNSDSPEILPKDSNPEVVMSQTIDSPLNKSDQIENISEIPVQTEGLKTETRGENQSDQTDIDEKPVSARLRERTGSTPYYGSPHYWFGRYNSRRSRRKKSRTPSKQSTTENEADGELDYSKFISKKTSFQKENTIPNSVPEVVHSEIEIDNHTQEADEHEEPGFHSENATSEAYIKHNLRSRKILGQNDEEDDEEIETEPVVKNKLDRAIRSFTRTPKSKKILSTPRSKNRSSQGKSHSSNNTDDPDWHPEEADDESEDNGGTDSDNYEARKTRSRQRTNATNSPKKSRSETPRSSSVTPSKKIFPSSLAKTPSRRGRNITPTISPKRATKAIPPKRLSLSPSIRASSKSLPQKGNMPKLLRSSRVTRMPSRPNAQFKNKTSKPKGKSKPGRQTNVKQGSELLEESEINLKSSDEEENEEEHQGIGNKTAAENEGVTREEEDRDVEVEEMEEQEEDQEVEVIDEDPHERLVNGLEEAGLLNKPTQEDNEDNIDTELYDNETIPKRGRSITKNKNANKGSTKNKRLDRTKKSSRLPASRESESPNPNASASSQPVAVLARRDIEPSYSRDILQKNPSVMLGNRSSSASPNEQIPRPPIDDPNALYVSANNGATLTKAISQLLPNFNVLEGPDFIKEASSSPLSRAPSVSKSSLSPQRSYTGDGSIKASSINPNSKLSGWTDDHWELLKRIYDETKIEYIQDGKYEYGNETVFQEVVKRFIAHDPNNEIFDRKNVRKRVIVLESVQKEKTEDRLLGRRRDSVDSHSSQSSKFSATKYKVALHNMRDNQNPDTYKKKRKQNNIQLNIESRKGGSITSSESPKRRRITENETSFATMTTEPSNTQSPSRFSSFFNTFFGSQPSTPRTSNLRSELTEDTNNHSFDDGQMDESPSPSEERRPLLLKNISTERISSDDPEIQSDVIDLEKDETTNHQAAYAKEQEEEEEEHATTPMEIDIPDEDEVQTVATVERKRTPGLFGRLFSSS